MRELVAIAAAGAVLGTVAVSSTASHATVGSNMATAVAAANPHRHDVAQHRHIHRHAARPAPGYTREGGAAPGCYRWGETGYHWYPFCLGPPWLYPHQRVCRGGYCWYY
jgi:hypothetical protein